jgi:hypothetical protein
MWAWRRVMAFLASSDNSGSCDGFSSSLEASMRGGGEADELVLSALSLSVGSGKGKRVRGWRTML